MRKKDNGIALVMVLSVLTVITILVVGTIFSTQQESFLTRNDNTSAQAAYVAQYGLQQAKTQLFQTYRYTFAHPPSNQPATRGACSNIISDGIDWNRNGILDSDESYPLTRTGTVTLGSGSGSFNYSITSDPNQPRNITIKTVGDAFRAKSTIQATFDVYDAGVWDYAIFSGKGSANKFINGGSKIHGGIYVQGDPSNPDQNVIDTGGNFEMSNSYNLDDYTQNGGVSNRVVSSLKSDDNLCATLRVKDGRVTLGGSNLFGHDDNKLLGFYVGNDPTTDIQGTQNGCTSNKGICSDSVGAFDLDPATAPTLPTFDGSKCTTDPTKTWRGCIQMDAANSGLRLVKGASTPGLPFGAVLLNPTQCSLSALSATTPLTMDSNTVDCTYSLGGISPAGGFKYVGATNPATFDVYGTVDLAGFNVVFGKDINYRAFGFKQTGRAAAFALEAVGGVGGNVTFNGSLLPSSTTVADRYPNQVLSVLAENNMTQKGQYVMGVMYAGGTYTNEKDNVVLGSMVANYFCTTSAGGGACNAGQKSEVVYIDAGSNRPSILNMAENASRASYRVLAYERR
jgi:hypothetical protein